jgi:hypothetical protein
MTHNNQPPTNPGQFTFPCDKSEFPNIVAKVQSHGLELVSGPKGQRGGETILFRAPSGNIFGNLLSVRRRMESFANLIG